MNRANRPRMSRISGSSRASKLMTRAGDGSTLSLDFTTGVLDSRITFTRSTNATFINSQGYVQFADANMFVNSAWTDANNKPEGWTLSTATGSISRLNETRTITCTAQQYWFFQQPASRTGLTYSVSVEVTAASGSIVYGDIILAGSSTTIAWYKDGVLQASGSSTTVTTGVITLIFTANGDNTILRLGLGTAGNNVTGSVTLRYPQFQQGQVPLRSYYENTSTSVARFNSARFDYDPTTLTPRGLLIEGSASNLLSYSQDVTQASKWTIQTSYASISATGGSAPDNTNTGNLCTESTGSAARSIYQSISPAAGTYTVSLWAKAGSGSARFIRLVLSSAAGNFVYVTANIATGAITQSATAVGTATAASATVTGHTGSWYRITLTGTLAAAANFIFIVPTDSGTASVNTSDYGRYTYTGDGSSFLIWGAQLEAGSAASSYIPTGASTVTKANDFAVISGSNFTPWFTGGTSGTFYADWYGGVRGVASNVRSVLATTDLTTRHLHMFQISAAGALRVADFNGSNSATTGNSLTSGARTQGAFSFAYPGSGTTSTVNVCLNGGTVASSSTMAFSVAPTFVSLGLPSTNGTTTSNADVILNNSIRSIKYWPTVLPNTTLQSLTT
jgi:hypothetical protein